MNRPRAGSLPYSATTQSERLLPGWHLWTALKSQNIPPLSLFSTIGDPSVCCVWVGRSEEKGGDAAQKRASGDRNKFRILSSVTSHLAKYPPVKMPRGSVAIGFVCTALQGCQKASRWKIIRGNCSAHSSLRLLFIPSVKVQYLPHPTLCIYQSHHGNLHSGGQELVFWFSAFRWRRLNTNQRSDIRWSFIKRSPLLGSRVVRSRSLPSGFERELWAKG